MALADRRRARKGSESPADREMRSHLDAAMRELDKARGVCGRIALSREPEDQALVPSAQRNRASLDGIIAQILKGSSMKGSLARDTDLLPENVRAQMSREASLKRRANAASKQRVQATEAAVHNVIASLAAAK